MPYLVSTPQAEVVAQTKRRDRNGWYWRLFRHGRWIFAGNYPSSTWCRIRSSSFCQRVRRFRYYEENAGYVQEYVTVYLYYNSVRCDTD